MQHTRCKHNTHKTDGSELSRRDSSVKKNAALIKKLRGVTEEARAALLGDVAKMNLSKASWFD